METTTELFKKMQLYRLTYDLTVTQKKIQENKMSAISSSDGFFARLGAGVSNSIKNSRLNNLVPQEQQIRERIQQYHAANPSLFSPTDEELGKLWTAIWDGGKNSELLKIMFCLSVALDTEYSYVYSDDSLTALSVTIWGNPTTMSNIKSEYRSVYMEIAKQPLSTTQKWVLGGTAALVLLTPFLAPVAFGGASAAAITGGLAGVGSTMVGGIGILAVAEMALDGIAIAATYGALDASNKAKVRGAFRQMDYNASAEMLAIKAYTLQVAKRLDSEDDYKERINGVLQMIQDLKSDIDYVLYVERDNLEENKRKINLFHNFDTKLAKIVSV